MKKLALAIAITAAAVSAQAQQTSVFTGTLDILETYSGFGGGSWGPSDSPAVSSLDYIVTYTANFGTFQSLTIELNGSLSTAGSPTVPPFAQQTWTFTDALYTINSANVTTSSTWSPDFSTLSGNALVNGGSQSPGAGAAGTLTSGTAVCGGGSCASFTPSNFLSQLTLDFALDANNTFAEISHSLALDFFSNSGATGYSMSASEVPVPAAAWLFGTALVGLAGVARKRNAG